MNKKFPYSTVGIDQFIAYLYSLPQAQLDQEIRSLLLHYVEWIYSHIDLSSEQLEQLRRLSPSFLFSCQQQIALALQLRLHIRLIKQDRPPSNNRTGDNPGKGKMHGIDFGLVEAQPDPDELPEEPNGELVYTITYGEGTED